MAEEFVSNFIAKLQKTNEIAFDIGANHGCYTVPLSAKFHTVYAFEPHPDNVKILRANVSACDNVVIVEKAISNVTGKTKLYTHSQSGMHTINPNPAAADGYGRRSDRFIEVDSITIDDFCKSIPLPISLIRIPVSLMKMDIESAEDFVWHGAIETLRSNKLNILLETHREVDLNQLTKFFTDLSYRIDPAFRTD